MKPCEAALDGWKEFSRRPDVTEIGLSAAEQFFDDPSAMAVMGVRIIPRQRTVRVFRSPHATGERHVRADRALSSFAPTWGENCAAVG